MELSRERLEQYTRAAIDACRAGIAAGQSPFGSAIITPDGRIVAAHNTVWLTGDITAHAEITNLRKACAELRRIDFSDCILIATTEPCPMCAAACHWARLHTVYYGASIADAASAGFNELSMPCETLLKGSQTRVMRAPLAAECRALFDEWKQRAGSRAY